MENIKNLSVIFTGNTTSLSAAFTKVAAEGDALNGKLKTVSAESDATAGKFASMATKIGASIGLAAAVVGVTSMKMAADFQQQMTYIRTDAGDTTDNIDQMSQAILHMTSQFDATTLAEGMYHIASLGLRGADALNALNTAQKMAAVGGSDLQSTATALGGALVTGIKGVQDYSSAAGTLDAIIGAGNMRMQDLVGAIGTGVLPVFKNAGLSLTDFGAALATLTDNGQQADAAATHLRMTIALMEAPSQKAQGILKELGMTQNQLGMDMQTKGLVPALTDLKQHLLDTYGTTDEGKVKMAQALTEMFGGGRSSAAIQTLIDQLDRVGNKETQISAQTGEFGQKVKEQMMTPMALAKTAVNKVKSAMDELGMGINNFTVSHLPQIEAGFKHLGDIFDNKLRPSFKALGDTITNKVWPILKSLWQDIIEPMIPVLGTVFVGAVWAVVNIFDGFLTAVSAVVDYLGKHSDVLYPLTVAFGILAGVMAFNAIFDALTTGFATLRLITIPGMVASLETIGSSSVVVAAKMIASFTVAATKMVAQAVIASAGWVAQAAVATGAWLLQLPKILASMAITAVKSALYALDTGVAWIINATRVSLEWTVTTMPKLVLSFITTSAAAVIHATATAIAWTGAAVKTSISWVVTEMPKLVASFVVTTAAAVAQAALTAAAWVLSASTTAIAWVVTTLPRIIAAFVVMAASAIANAAIATAAWVASAVTTTETFTALKLFIASPIAMGAIAVAGAIADIMLVWKAVNTVKQAISDMNAASASAAGYKAAQASTHAELLQLQATGDAGQKSRANKLLSQGYATGTNYAPGGLSLVGEKGPELVQLPRGSQVHTNAESKAMTTNNRSVSIGTIILASADAVKEMFNQLDRDNLLVSKGLSPARGM